MATDGGTGTVSYGVHVVISSVSGILDDHSIVRIKAKGSRDEAVLIRAVQSYARSIADLRAARPTSTKSIDLSPWWEK
jgi:hypothetical protein